MKKIFILLAVISISCSCTFGTDPSTNVTLHNPTVNVYLKQLIKKHQFDTPEAKAYKGGIKLSNIAYDCYLDPELHISRYACYSFQPTEDYQNLRRKGNWKNNPELNSIYQISDNSYKGSGFDRGHQAPDASVRCWGNNAQFESYYFSNCTPQNPKLNRGIWKRIEAEIRNLATMERPVYVITGPVFYKNLRIRKIGQDEVAIPHAYFCIISTFSSVDPFCIMSFIIENEEPMEDDMQNFEFCSVDYIESLTGFDFLIDDESGSPWLKYEKSVYVVLFELDFQKYWRN